MATTVSIPVCCSSAYSIASISSQACCDKMPAGLQTYCILFCKCTLGMLSTVYIFSSSAFSGRSIHIKSRYVSICFISVNVAVCKFFDFPGVFFLVLFIRYGMCSSRYNPELLWGRFGFIKRIDHPCRHVCVFVTVNEKHR